MTRATLRSRYDIASAREFAEAPWLSGQKLRKRPLVPVGGEYNYILHPETFARMLKGQPPGNATLLDPSFAGHIEQHPLAAFPEYYRRVDHDLNNLMNQQAIAQRGASRRCSVTTARSSGEASLYFTPFPTEPAKQKHHHGNRHLRHETGARRYEPVRAQARSVNPNVCGAAGNAFGIGEIDEAMRDLEERGYTVHRRHSVDVLIERHRPGTAPLMCTRALRRLWPSSPTTTIGASGSTPRSRSSPTRRARMRSLTSGSMCCTGCARAMIRSSRTAFRRKGRSGKSHPATARKSTQVGGFSPDDDDALGRLGPG